MSDELKTVDALAAALAPTAEQRGYMESMSPAKIQRVQNSLNSMKHGLHAVAPVTCGGPRKCPFIAHCPIPTRQQKSDKDYGVDADYPLMLPCVLESAYQSQRILDYCQHLQVDVQNPIEMSVVNELAVLDLHKNRALMIMSEGDRDGEGRDFLRQDHDYTEVGDGHELVKKTTLHPAFDVLDKLERRRERLLERLLETRKSRAEIDLKRGYVAADSNVLRELQAVRKYLQAASTRSLEDPEALDLPD